MQILVLGILALWGGYSLIPSNEEDLEKQFVLAAGENEEVCLTVHPDQEFKLTFTASEPVYYDIHTCLLYTSPSPRDLSTSRMPSSA